MPRLGRIKGHYSCDFCRVRKLRCSRPLPCINCVSRGKTCVLEAEPGSAQVHVPPAHGADREGEGSERQAQPARTGSAGHAGHAGHSGHAGYGQTTGHIGQAPPDLVNEVHRLRQLAEDLERRITHPEQTQATQATQAQSKAQKAQKVQKAQPQAQARAHTPWSPASTQAPSAATPDTGPAAAPYPRATPAEGICSVVSYMDRVSMGKGVYEAPWSVTDNGPPALVFRVAPLRDVATAPAYVYTMADGQLASVARVVYLPAYAEAVVLVDTYLRSVSNLYHIVHHPSMPGLVRRLYDAVEQGAAVPLGEMLLLVAIVATGTYLYSPPTGTGTGGSGPAPDIVLFASRAEGARQTPLWIQAAQHVLEAVLRTPSPASLVAVQGVITLSFLTSNVDGVAFRYRQLLNTGLLLSRELGLHCMDLAPAVGCVAPTATAAWNAIDREIGRRVWWYLAATDWLLAERNGGAGVGVYQVHAHLMCVREPRNIDDCELTADGPEPADRPLAERTDMSGFLQRLRLAKIARGIVDRMPMMARPHAVALMPGVSPQLDAISDAQLDAMLREMPPFFRLDTHDDTHAAVPDDLFIPAYMIHSNIHTQRCKLHLSYLAYWRYDALYPGTHGPARAVLPSASDTSRLVCLESARQIIRAGMQLKRRSRSHPIVKSRLSCVLYGIFLATIVLMIDLCVVGLAADGDAAALQKQHAEAAEALGIVANARSHSPAAAELYATLTQFAAKHRPALLAELQLEPVDRLDRLDRLAPTPGTHATPHTSAESTPAAFYDNTLPAASLAADLSLDNALALNFEGLDGITYQWDDFLSTFDTTMFPS